jgi:hypothetical protein
MVLNFVTSNLVGKILGLIIILLLFNHHYYYYLFIYFNCKWVFRGGSGTTIKHNTQISQITQNNTPHSNKTQHTKLNKH